MASKTTGYARRTPTAGRAQRTGVGKCRARHEAILQLRPSCADTSAKQKPATQHSPQTPGKASQQNLHPRARPPALPAIRPPIFVQAILLAFALSLPVSSFAQDAAEYFRTRCTSCHTIGGGRLTGPDLKNVMQRAATNGRDREWLIRFIQDPQAMIQSGDAYALKLQHETPGNAVMPTQPDMTRPLAGSLLDMIQAESKSERSQFAGSPISLAPFTPKDVQLGRKLFLGTRPLTGVASCGGGRSTVPRESPT